LRERKLGRSRRLTQWPDIRHALERGTRFSNAYSTLFLLSAKDANRFTNARTVNRFTVIVKRGVSRNNVVRNRLKRCVREAYRKSQPDLEVKGQDRVLVIRDAAVFKRTRAQWASEFLELLGKSNG